MSNNIRKLIQEIANNPHKELMEVQEKIEIVQDEGLNLIAQANKEKNAKKSSILFQRGDGIIEKLTKAVCR